MTAVWVVIDVLVIASFALVGYWRPQMQLGRPQYEVFYPAVVIIVCGLLVGRVVVWVQGIVIVVACGAWLAGRWARVRATRN